MRHVLINNIEHRELRVASHPSAEYGDNVHFALVVPRELRAAKNFYPIFIQKGESSGKFFLAALLGLQEGENLFLRENSWKAEYIPLSVQRQPFLIGQQTGIENGERIVNRVINIDIDSPRVNVSDGERLFTESGETTPYLNNIADMLETLHHGLIESDRFIERLLAYNLLEPMTLKVDIDQIRKYELDYLYTINEDVLEKLENEKVLSLFRDGSLEKIYSLIHSQARVSTLIRLKNECDMV